ncbi:hypothetical protein [Nocardioides sp. KR10-350]|uniref:hypothetical protein n=1 Tax=Nocardioides cheoyonin TaxID=3156615 RepID=UPI0032B3E912
MSESDLAATLQRTDQWFLRHGLTYFVPEQRAAVRAALRPRRTALPTVLGFVVAAVLGVLLGWATGQAGTGVALLLTVGALGVAWYALTALRFRPILAWALGRTFGSLARLLPMVSRALPLLLLFVTFLFINADVWQMSAYLEPGTLWLTALLFAVSAIAFLLVRLPEEVDRVDDDVDGAFLTRACRGTPLEGPCAELLADAEAGRGPDPAAYATITGYERWNLVLALLVIQAVQVLLIAVAVFGFFVVFGALVLDDAVQQAWTGLDNVHSLSWLPSVSVELVQVSVFLAAFSLLYITVSTVTDETYRAQFFGTVLRELERAVGMRAVYLALRARDRDTRE